MQRRTLEVLRLICTRHRVTFLWQCCHCKICIPKPTHRSLNSIVKSKVLHLSLCTRVFSPWQVSFRNIFSTFRHVWIVPIYFLFLQTLSLFWSDKFSKLWKHNIYRKQKTRLWLFFLFLDVVHEFWYYKERNEKMSFQIELVAI